MLRSVLTRLPHEDGLFIDPRKLTLPLLIICAILVWSAIAVGQIRAAVERAEDSRAVVKIMPGVRKAKTSLRKRLSKLHSRRGAGSGKARSGHARGE